MLDILPTADDPSSPSSAREYIAEDDDFQGLYPGIFEFLARIKVGGKDRLPSRLVIYYEDQQLTVMLTDPQNENLLFHTEEHYETALIGLNARLMDPPVRGWKQDKRYHPKR